MVINLFSFLLRKYVSWYIKKKEFRVLKISHNNKKTNISLYKSKHRKIPNNKKKKTQQKKIKQSKDNLNKNKSQQNQSQYWVSDSLNQNIHNQATGF